MSNPETTIPYTASLDAAAWWDGHKPHVDRLIKSQEGSGSAYPPSGSDQYHPELWKAPHWRWFDGVVNGK